jgi:hypothetical protein
MILASAVILGLLIGIVRHRGGILRQIAALQLRIAGLALLAVVLQWPLFRSPAGPVEQFRIEQALFLVSHLLLLAFVWRNRQLLGVQIVGLGVLCNLAVILTNGGYMPITPETLVQLNPSSTLMHWASGNHYGHSKDIILLREQVRLWALSDIFVLPPPFWRPTAFSLGDLFIALGIIVLLQLPATPSTPILTRASAQ